jgi:ribosomal protein S18 acetylase RimI-like enzyme
VPLDDGLVLRTATDDDFDQIVSLSLEAHGDQESWGLHYVTDRYGIDSWSVVVDGPRVVSTCLLMDHQVELGAVDGVSVTFPAGQIEYVATHADYRRRGLVRTQFEAHHRVADERGDLVVFVAGIPFFYRALGYSYGLSYPTMYRVVPDLIGTHDGWEIGRATLDDLPVLRRLHDRAQDRTEVRIRRSDDDWRALLDPTLGDDEALLVARSDGETRGWLRQGVYERDGMRVLLQSAAADLTAAEVLVRHLVDAAAGDDLYLLDRPGDPTGALLESVAFPADDFNALFTRVADPRAFLERIRPVLDDRLARSVLAADTGELLISLYARSIRLTYDRGLIGDIAWAPGVEEPDGKTTIGVPEDAFAPLVLGRFGASTLASRIDDLTLGRQRALADILFPRLTADVIGVL